MQLYSINTKLHNKDAAKLSNTPNNQTLTAYNNHAIDYIQKTPQNIFDYAPEMRTWIDVSLRFLKPSSSIFEIGSATSRDANYIREKGFSVTCSDAVEEFVKLLKKQDKNVLTFNILKDNFQQKFDMIFANGVFPHFTPDETRIALKNVVHGLTPNGILAISIKYGVGEEWIKEKFNEGRFTHYWSKQEIEKLLFEEGFEIMFENSNKGSYPSHRWLNLTCRLRK